MNIEISLGLLILALLIPKYRYVFRKYLCAWTKDRYLTWIQKLYFLGVHDFSRFWNKYEVHGLDKVEKFGGNCLMVGYHSRCTLDLVYLLCAIQPSVIATHLMFKIPIMRSLLSEAYILPSGTGKNAKTCFIKALSESKRPLLLLPGGVYECIKPMSQIGKIQWKTVPGFARIIHQERNQLGSKTKVVPFYTKNCEQCFYRSDVLYEVSGWLGRNMYDMFRRGHIWLLPIMLTCFFLSVGFKILPRPVKLDTYIGDPVVLKQGETPEDFSRRVTTATQELVDRIEALPQQESDFSKLWHSKCVSDRFLLWKLSIDVALVGAYTIVQNTLLVILVYVLIWLPVVLAYYAIYRCFNYATSA